MFAGSDGPRAGLSPAPDRPYLFGMTDATMESTLTDRALIRVSGDGARDFLQGLVTQDVTTLDSATPRWSALLTPQGKVIADFLLWADDEAVLIDCEAGQAEALAKRLTMYRLRKPIAIAPAEGAVHWSPTPGTGVADPRLAALGHRWLAPAGAAAGGWLEHRLSLGVTEGVAELGDTLWLECNARELNGVSFTKGCYVGQENTARMHHRAKVNRRLVVAPIGEAGDRTRIRYEEIGLMVELRRVEALGNAIVPEWLAQALD